MNSTHKTHSPKIGENRFRLPQHRFSAGILVGVFLFWASLSRAQNIIVNYDFEGTSLAPRVIFSDATASSFGTGAGLNNIFTSNDANVISGADSFGGTRTRFNAGGNVAGVVRPRNLGESLNSNDYMTFTVAPNAGCYFDLDTFDFLTAVNTANRGAESWALFSSIGGFAAPDVITAGATPSNTTASNSIALGSEFQNLTNSVEFRLYIWGFGGHNSNSSTRFDDFFVYGVGFCEEEEDEEMDVIDFGGIAQLLNSAIPMNLAVGQVASQIHNVGSSNLNYRIHRLRQRHTATPTNPTCDRFRRNVSASRFSKVNRDWEVRHTIHYDQITDQQPVSVASKPSDTLIINDSAPFIPTITRQAHHSVSPDVIA